MLKNPSHLCLPKQLNPCLLLALLCMEAALSPAETRGAQPCTSPVTPLEGPAIKSDVAKLDWVMVVADREQLESPIPPLPYRTRQAHSNGNAKARGSRATSPSELAPPLFSQQATWPLRHLSTPTHHLSKLQSNAGSHLRCWQTPGVSPPSKFPLLLGKGCVDFSCMQSNIKHVHPFKAMKRAATLLFLIKHYILLFPPGNFLLHCNKKHKQTCKKIIKMFCLFVLVRGCVGFL